MVHSQVLVVAPHSHGWLSGGNHEEETEVLAVKRRHIIKLAKSAGSAYGHSMAFK